MQTVIVPYAVFVVYGCSEVPYSGIVWRALNLANWLLEGIGEIKFGDLILSTIGAYAIIYIGELLIWRPLPNSLNRQIKNFAKISHYMVSRKAELMLKKLTQN